MAVENVTFFSIVDITTVPAIISILKDESVGGKQFNVSINPLPSIENFSNESMDGNSKVYDGLQSTMPLFEAFVSTEIVMTALELLIPIIAALKIPRWTKNYRNQMLMQLSLARFVKRIVNYIEFVEQRRTAATPTNLSIVLFGSQTYIDFVIVILVICFIKHMYDSLIVVIVKINQGSFFKTLSCAWLLPMPISAAWAGVVSAKVMDKWLAYLVICGIFRWPLIFIGTTFYITILFRVFTEKIRNFARSLTFTTFLICLVVNFYLFSKDVIELWCFKSFLTVLVSYVLGLLLNLLILCFYIILIIQNYRKKFKSPTSVPD